jgi:hypothetical protein
MLAEVVDVDEGIGAHGRRDSSIAPGDALSRNEETRCAVRRANEGMVAVTFDAA